MKTIEVINITEEAIDPHISNTKSAKRIVKNTENISFKNLKSSTLLKASSNSKNEINNKLNQTTTKKSNTKRVKFKKDVTIINVECWKEYNLNYPSDGENLENNIEENNNNKENKNIIIKKRKKSKDKNVDDNKKNDISCTCLIV